MLLSEAAAGAGGDAHAGNTSLDIDTLVLLCVAWWSVLLSSRVCGPLSAGSLGASAAGNADTLRLFSGGVGSGASAGAGGAGAGAGSDTGSGPFSTTSINQ